MKTQPGAYPKKGTDMHTFTVSNANIFGFFLGIGLLAIFRLWWPDRGREGGAAEIACVVLAIIWTLLCLCVWGWVD